MEIIQDSRFKIQNIKSVCFLIFTLLITHYSLLITAAHAASVDETVDRIQNTFAGINDITGSFSQTSYIKDMEETQKYSGTFFIKKPSQLMWEYAKPRDEKITIKNNDTWIYKKSQNQVVKTKFSKEAYSQVPIALLTSFENIKNDFNITIAEENSLQLVPKKKIGAITSLAIETAPKGFPVKMITVNDTYGNIIKIKLTNVNTNQSLEDNIFDFIIPPGAEVYDMGQ